MYARKYYLIIYRRNLLPEYSRTSQQQYSPRSPFTSFTIHFFTFTFSPFSLHFLSIFSPFPFPFPFYLTHHSFLSTSQHPGQRLKKNGTTLSFLAKMY